MSTNCRVIQGGICEVTQGYVKGRHDGIDLVNKGYTLGNIVAHSDGIVVDIVNNCNENTNGEKGHRLAYIYGNYVKIKHDNGYYTLYAHGKYKSVKVNVGDRVFKGEVIMYMGDTGYSFGGHLHFEVRNNNDIKIDPTKFLNSDLSSELDKYTDLELAKMVWEGKFGNGQDRINKLGSRYNNVQSLVNKGIGKEEKSTKYKIGDKVIINGVYISSMSTDKLIPLINKGTITKIIEGAKNPYLLDNGNIGWINESVIKEKL